MERRLVQEGRSVDTGIKQRSEARSTRALPSDDDDDKLISRIL